MISNSPKINVIHKACMKAARSLIRDFGEIEKLQVSAKGPGDYVSAADKKSEKIIIEELLKAHPDYSILSEESGEINSGNKNKRWIIDPIDGTSNFLNGIPQFAISIAFEEQGELTCGVIFDPIKNEMFFAEKGSGAFLNNSRIRVSGKKKLNKSMLVTNGPRYTSNKRDFIFDEYKKVSNLVEIPIRKFGSAALDLAYVSSGRFDGCWQWDLNYWDIAAGLVILKESGGYLSFLDKDTKHSKTKSIVASNSNIHQELLEAITKKNIE